MGARERTFKARSSRRKVPSDARVTVRTEAADRVELFCFDEAVNRRGREPLHILIDPDMHNNPAPTASSPPLVLLLHSTAYLPPSLRD